MWCPSCYFLQDAVSFGLMRRNEKKYASEDGLPLVGVYQVVPASVLDLQSSGDVIVVPSPDGYLVYAIP